MKNRLAKVIDSKSKTCPVIFCDFDGTITEVDATDQILTQLAHPSWREVEQEWTRGLIGSRECMERQLALVETTSSELNAVIDAIPVDPNFVRFDRLSQDLEIPLYVVSDGQDYVIHRVLRRAGVRRFLRNGSNFYSSVLRLEGGRLRVSFPHASPGCTHGCATCKPALIRRHGRGHYPVIYIGDGLSDRFGVETADIIFAKRQLLSYCRQHGLDSHAFDSFSNIAQKLPPLLESLEDAAPAASASTKSAVVVRG